MSLIQAGLKTPTNITDKGLVVATPAKLRYADKAEIVATANSTVIQNLFHAAEVDGIPNGINHLTERSSKSKAGILHHNIRSKLTVPTFTVAQGATGPKAKVKNEEITVSTSVSLPTRLRNDPEFMDAISKMVAVQITSYAQAYEAELSDLCANA